VISEAAKRADGILVITDAQAWSGLPDRGQHVRRLHEP
jgi:hypothetical protein